MTSTQETIGRFVAKVELRQPSGSAYFAADGGVSLQKVADNLGMSTSAVQADATVMVGQGLLVQTVRSSGAGFKATSALFSAIAAIDAANAQAAADAIVAAFLPTNHAEAKALIDLLAAQGMEWRALVLIILDEFNVLRQWLASFKTEVAAAASLADLKTRVATLPGTADRTITQLKTAFKAKIDAGSAD